MNAEYDDARRRLASLSASTRRLLDYVALLGGDARYAVLRHMARSPEPDMIADLREATDAGIVAPVAGQPNSYQFTDELLRELILDDIGEARLPKLQARANAARERTLGGPQ